MRATAIHCRVRPMEPGDIPQVLDIERQSFTPMWPQTVYQRELSNKMARYLVLCEPLPQGEAAPGPDQPPSAGGFGGLVRRFFGGLPARNVTTDRILGLVGLWRMLAEGHIVTIAVREDYRRLGIGELLLVAALEAAVEMGQDVVTLEYRMSNDAARAMYDKYGFEHVGVRARYYSDNQEDAVLMTTPSLSSPEYRALLSRLLAEQASRWGEDYPLAGRAAWVRSPTPSG